MKILIISTGSLPLPPVKGGAVEHLIDILLKENDFSKKLNITVTSIDNNIARVESEKYKMTNFKFINISSKKDQIEKVIRYSINKLPGIYMGNKYITKVIKSINNLNSFDIVVVENAPEYGLILRKYYKGRMILHLHNDYLNEKSKLSVKKFDVYDDIFALSKFVALKVKKIKESSKVKVLYNGIDLKKFHIELNENHHLKRKYNIREKDFVFIYSGRLVPEKGVKELIYAFNNLSNKKNIKLIIVGSPKYGNTVNDSYVAELKKIGSLSNENVVFTGYIPYEQIAELYSLANVGVVPSLCNEGFNLTVVEFLASSMPVIISDRGAMNELITSDCGLIVQSNQNFIKNLEAAMENLKEDNALFNNLKQNARKQSELFSKEIYCNNFFSLLDI